MSDYYGLDEIVLPEGYYINISPVKVDFFGYPRQYFSLCKKGRWFNRVVVGHNSFARYPAVEADNFRAMINAYFGKGGVASGRLTNPRP